MIGNTLTCLMRSIEKDTRPLRCKKKEQRLVCCKKQSPFNIYLQGFKNLAG